MRAFVPGLGAGGVGGSDSHLLHVDDAEDGEDGHHHDRGAGHRPLLVTVRWCHRPLVVSERAVEKHVTGIFSKLDLGVSSEDHRRVLAVLRFLDQPA